VVIYNHYLLGLLILDCIVDRMKEIPALWVLSERASIDDIEKEVENNFSDDSALAGNIKIYLTKRYTGKRLKEIGDLFGIGETGVSQSC
jgi:putative transposase